MPTIRLKGTAAAVLACCCSALTAFAGPIAPPAGPVAPTPGPEPRTAISAATTPGDADSVFRIAQPGSYYLTGNITGVSGKRGIEIAASNVTIDLGGFTLAGVAGSLQGISSDGFRNITIRGGDVTGWGAVGISLALVGAPIGGRIECVRTSLNGSSGISASQGMIFDRCISVDNAGSGIGVQGDSVFEACVAISNTGIGFSAGTGSIVRSCVARLNGGDGIRGQGVCTISGCTIQFSGEDGISVLSRCTITGCTSIDNTGHGIVVNDTCLISGNTCASNGLNATSGAGILCVTAGNRVERNHARHNDIGIQATSGGSLIIGNSAGSNGLNYSFAAGNRYGPVLNLTAGGTAAVSGDSAPGTLTTSDANANIAY